MAKFFEEMNQEKRGTIVTLNAFVRFFTGASFQKSMGNPKNCALLRREMRKRRRIE